MPTKKETAIAPADNFSIVRVTDGISEELLAEINDELDDLGEAVEPNYLKIKVPASGALAYEVQTEDDEVEYKKTIDAIIIFTHTVNARWPQFGTGDAAKIPVCSSMDGKAGLSTESGEVVACSTCPYNAFGSGVSSSGERTRGKACKNMRRLYLVQSGDPNLYLLTVPPTSMKDVSRQLRKIISSGSAYTGTIVRLSIDKARNSAGTDYSKVVLKRLGPAPAEVAARAVELRKEIKSQYQTAAITIDDYTPSDASPAQASPVIAPPPAPVATEAPPAYKKPAQTVIFEEAPPIPGDDPNDEELPF